MSEADTEGYKKSKLDAIIEDQNEEYLQGITENNPPGESTDENHLPVTNESDTNGEGEKNETENLEGFKKTKLDAIIEDLDEEKLQEDAEAVKNENILSSTDDENEEPDHLDAHDELTETEYESDTNADTSDTDYGIEEENMMETENENEGEEDEQQDMKKRDTEKTSFSTDLDVLDPETIINKIISEAIKVIAEKYASKDKDQNIRNKKEIPKITHIGEEPEEDIKQTKKRKGPQKFIDDIVVNIDDLGKRYSEHGTEFSRPISHLWKKGKARDDILAKLKCKESRQVYGEKYTSTNPFILNWSHGFTVTIPILNLSKKNKIKVGMACAHTVIIYNYKKQRERLFQGHKNMVQCINCDMLGRWVVSADAGEDNTVTVWDLKTGIPIKTYFTPYPEGTRFVCFDLTAIYIITVSFGQQIISIWAWTTKAKKPEASFQLPSTTPGIRRIGFSPDNKRFFAFMTISSIITCTHHQKSKKITVYISKTKSKTHSGQLTDIVYVPRTHLIYTPTTQGYVIWWSDEPFHKAFTCSKETLNKKLQIKQVRLQEDCITVMRFIHIHKRMIITGDIRGRIAFYDVGLKILHWCFVNVEEPIISIKISCNAKRQSAKRNREEYKNALSPSGTGQKQKEKNKKEMMAEKTHENIEDSEDEKRLPSDATLERNPFLAINFVVSTLRGTIYYVNYKKGKKETLYKASPVPVTAVVAHPYRNYVFFGNSEGEIFMYDYIHKTIILETKIKKEFAKDYQKPITCLAISSLGSELAVGLENGALHFYDPVLLTKDNDYFNNCTTAIRKIVFDKNSNYLAHTDDDMCVSLYGLGKPKNFMGKLNSHFKPTTDIMFTFKTSTLYSIGKDRRLATYTIPESFEETINLLKLDILEQFALPLAMADYGTDADGFELLIIATDEYKYRIYHTGKCCIIKTAQTLCLPTPIKFLQTLKKYETEDNPTFIVFGTNKEIGVQMLPADGNPYKALAYIGSATDLTGMSVSYDNSYMFTISKHDPSMLIWEVNRRAVRMSAYYGGEGLHPYYCLLEGGYDGPLLKEIKDFFYYCQIVHDGEYLTGSRHVHDKMHLCDLTNFFNAIGFFPSIKEAEHYMYEIRRNTTKKDSEIQITFEEVLKLYLNHRPGKGVFERDVRNAFETFSSIEGENKFQIHKFDFIQALQRYGEPFTLTELDATLETLLGKQIPLEEFKSNISIIPSPQLETNLEHYQGLPEFIKYDFFLKEIIGVNTETFEIEEIIDHDILHPKSLPELQWN